MERAGAQKGLSPHRGRLAELIGGFFEVLGVVSEDGGRQHCCCYQYQSRSFATPAVYARVIDRVDLIRNRAAGHLYQSRVQGEAMSYENFFAAALADSVDSFHSRKWRRLKRQMVIAVSEKFLLADTKSDNSSFVFKGLEVSFKSFSFPLPSILKCHIATLERRKSSTRYTASVSIEQAFSSICEIKFEYGISLKDIMERRENSLLHEAILRETGGIIKCEDKFIEPEYGNRLCVQR